MDVLDIQEIHISSVDNMEHIFDKLNQLNSDSMSPKINK